MTRLIYVRSMAAAWRVEASQLQAVIANVPGVVYRCQFDADWTMDFISDGIEVLTGFAPDDFLDRRRSFDDIIHPDDRALVRDAVSDGVAAGRPFSCEYRIVCATGAVRWVLERGRPSMDDEGRWLDGVIFDITDRKVLEQELRRSLTEEAAATERVRLAQELHDSVGHALTIGIIQAGVADRAMDLDPPAAREALGQVGAAMRRALHEMRQVVTTLSKSDDPELEERLEGLVRSAEKSGMDVTMSIEGDLRRLGAAVGVSLYRTVQECLTNCAKHGHGARVTVSLRTIGGQVELTVSDDGTGCANPADIPSGGRGLDSIRERAHSLGGTFHAGPDESGGFSVTVGYPAPPGATNN